MQTSRRTVRVFISSTFRDMHAERDELMTHTWPVLRRLCRERHVELVEVDLRWGIAEEQSARKETLKLCLDEIRACRPFFIGLLGERYGWTPGDDAFTADLQEEQPWLAGLQGRSVTELEILHGVLNNPEMADRAFFYFRDPAYAPGRGPDFRSETDADSAKQTALKTLIRSTCTAKKIPLREDYPEPGRLAAMVLADLTAAIEEQFPKDELTDDLTREEQGHETFAEIRRRTYIGRTDYFDTLDRHAAGEGGPLLLLGDSGSGKSALLANWLEHWRQQHPQDFSLQHYIGGTADSADHWRLMTRLMATIKRWTRDPEILPTTHDDILKDFPLWLAKARAMAAHEGVRFILALDALNQLNDQNHARLLGWLPEHPFTGPLRLIVSTLPGRAGTDDPLAVARQRGWKELRIQPLTGDERRRMIDGYLARFSKRLDARRLNRLTSVPATANPLYLKTLLDELRVTGTQERLDERLVGYLSATDIPALLQQILARYQRDYDRDRPGLVGETLGLLYAARRGLSESELLQLLRPPDQAQLPPALWTPLRAALEESLVDRSGILNFAHDFLRTAVENVFAADLDRRRGLRLQLADYFEVLPITARTCDELPWLLKEINSRARLRACLLHIDRLPWIQSRDQNELMAYWIWMQEERTMGKDYLASFDAWSQQPGRKDQDIAVAASQLTAFLRAAAQRAEAESLTRRALAMAEHSYGKDHREVAICLSNLAVLLQDTNRLAEAEPLMRRALAMAEQSCGKDHPQVAICFNNLAGLLQDSNRLAEAEPLYRRALTIVEQSCGKNHPEVARALNNLAQLLKDTNRLAEAEPPMRRALAMTEQSCGKDDPEVAVRLSNLAGLLRATNRPGEAEPLYRRALAIDEQSYGKNHPDVATNLNNLAQLLQGTNRLAEAEPLMRRALTIVEQSCGKDHPEVAIALNNLALLLQDTNRLAEAEPLMRRALAMAEHGCGKDHPQVAIYLNNLAQLLRDTNRLAEAEPLVRRALTIFEQSYGEDHARVAIALGNLAGLLCATNRPGEAEPLYRRALAIAEQSYGKNHPDVAINLSNLAQLLQRANRLAEAEPLMRRALEILLKSTRTTGHPYPHMEVLASNYASLLRGMGRSPEQIRSTLEEMGHRFEIDLEVSRLETSLHPGEGFRGQALR